MQHCSIPLLILFSLYFLTPNCRVGSFFIMDYVIMKSYSWTAGKAVFLFCQGIASKRGVTETACLKVRSFCLVVKYFIVVVPVFPKCLTFPGVI